MFRRSKNCTSEQLPRATSTRIAVLTDGCRMLEDKTHEDVVRWGDEGDSFVVLEV